MTATKSEATNFYWHCRVAAAIAKFPKTPATSANARHAVRMATLNAAGRKGINLASSKARSARQTSGKNWSACGLIKEHLVPISTIFDIVLRELDNPEPRRWADYVDVPTDQNLTLWGIPANWVTTLEAVPDELVIARVIKDNTALAWIHKDDDMKLRAAGYTKCMPQDWNGRDRYARYKACGIELVDISGTESKPTPAIDFRLTTASEPARDN